MQRGRSVCDSGRNCRIQPSTQTISGALEVPPAKKSFLSCVQPATNLFLTEAPLSTDFQRRNFSAFRPKAHGPWRYTKPSRNGGGRKKHVLLFAPSIKHCRTTPKLEV